jgi:hypothetical protein
MKVSDILNKYRMLEDDSMKIKSVSGNDVTLDQGGSEIKTTTDALVPAADKPGQFAMKPADPSSLKPGAIVNSDTTTSEEIDDDERHPDTQKHYHDWMNSEYAPYDDDSGDHNAVHNKAIHFLHSRGVHPGDIEFHAHHMAHKFHGGIDETHKDLISQGNQDVGGDATGGAGYKRGFVNDVVDKDFERSNRNAGGKLKESDELMKWLTIAGIR